MLASFMSSVLLEAGSIMEQMVCSENSSDNGLFCVADIPMSVGIIDPRANPTQLNTVEFLWDPSKRTSVFIQVA